jgi:hypothetical protein
MRTGPTDKSTSSETNPPLDKSLENWSQLQPLGDFARQIGEDMIRLSGVRPQDRNIADVAGIVLQLRNLADAIEGALPV